MPSILAFDEKACKRHRDEADLNTHASGIVTIISDQFCCFDDDLICNLEMHKRY